MTDPRTPIELLGLILSISALIAGAYLLMERLFAYRVFSVFLALTPKLLQSLFPHDATIAWFTIRSGRSLYDAWDVALVYLFLLPALFVIEVGCWVFLALRLAGISYIGTSWLFSWFVFNWFIYSWSAVNQYAVEIKIKNKKATPEGIKKSMIEDPGLTLKRWIYYFLRNWLVTPLIASALVLIIILFVLLHWPAWVIKAFPKIHLNLDNKRSRTYYYLTYMLLAGIPGLVLTFLAK